MAGKLSVQFELEAGQVQQQGAQAGRQYGQAFSNSAKKEIDGWLSKMGPAARASMLSQLGVTGSGNIITPPGVAPGPSGILKLLNLVQTSHINPAIKGLREVGGGDLAKVAALPDINSFSRSGSLKSLMLGLGAAPFSSWIGARMLSESAFGGGKAGGGLLGKGGAGGFAEFFIGIELLKKAFEYGAEKIKQVVEKGFELYTRAAQLRRSVGSLFAIQEAGQQVGLGQEQIDQFMLRNNWGKARTSLQNFGVFSQLGGMSKDFKDALRWSTEIAQSWEDTSLTSYQIHVNVERIKTDWLTIWNNSGFLNGLEKLTRWTDTFLHMAAMLKLSLRETFDMGIPLAVGLGKAGAFGKNSPLGDNGNQMFGLKQSLPVMGAWEKMGFVIGGGVAQDSKKMVHSLEQIQLLTIQTVAILAKLAGSGGKLTPAYTGPGHQNFNPP